MPDTARLSTALADRYVIERELGAGGMATVYLARDLKHDREVALKVLRPELAAVLGTERFLREITTTASLRHPHILPLYDSGEAAGFLYYVMPCVEGESLRDRLDREKQLPLDDALTIAREVADALGYAHGRGIVHRDIKPENVLLESGHAAVADFGIARAITAAGGGRLTDTGMAVGTPMYMSPEQAAGERDVDGRSDLYSLGCVLFEMLAGQPPFTGPTVESVVHQHLAAEAPAVTQLRPAVPADVADLIAGLLAKTPADRLGTGAQLVDALARTQAGARAGAAPARATPLERPGRGWIPRGRRALVTATVVLVALAAAAGWLASRGRPPARSASAGRPRAGEPTRLAVLPIASLGTDPDDRVFSDGITEELISTLGNVSGLRVLARSAVLRYASQARSAAEVGRELDVGSVLEGTLRRSGNRVRITVHLIDVATQEQRWGEDFDRELAAADLFAIQTEVALKVAEALRVQLVPSEARQVAKRPTESLEAYELYLRATLLFAQERQAAGGGSDSAISLLRRAIAIDERFAMAHAALARVYSAQLFDQQPGSRLRRLAEAEISRALALDSTLAEAYHARGDLAWTRESGWQHEAALRDYLRALELKPNLVAAHASLGRLLSHVGLLAEARQELEITLSLDNTNRFAPPLIPRVMWYQQKFDTALARYDAMGPLGPVLASERAIVLGYLGRAAEGLAALDERPAAGNGDGTAARAVLLARLGRPAEVDALARQAEREGGAVSHFHHVQFNLATAYALSDRPAKALRRLERAAADGMPAYELFAGDPTLAAVRDSPEGAAFMRTLRASWERYRGLLRAYSSLHAESVPSAAPAPRP